VIHELFLHGGPIVRVLFALSVIAGGIVVAKAVLFALYRRRLHRSTELALTPEGSGGSFVARQALQLARGLTTLRVIGSAAPLLGLLGTVIGLFRSFQAVAEHGLGDPSQFAEGVSLALTTTIAGLLVALPTIAAHQYLSAVVESLVLELEARVEETPSGVAAGPARDDA
jgi:biopolymer transport protein ExbB